MDFFELEDVKAVCRKRRIRVDIPIGKVKRAVEFAKKRNGKENKFGAMTYGGKLSGIKAHVIGILAEEAVAQYFGKSIDTEVFDSHGDDGVDLPSVPGYGSVGVKSTTYGDDPYMRVEIEHFSDRVDSYVLVYVNPDLTKLEVFLIGWAKKEEVSKAVQKRFSIGKSGRFGPMNYVLEEHQLRGFDEGNQPCSE